MSKRLKILVSAYACSPIRGSEPGMGWGFIRALAKYHDLWVIVEQEKFQEEVENGLMSHPELQERVKFFFIAKKRHRRLRKIWPPSYYWFYRQWQKEVLRLARQLCDQAQFDLVHQLNMVGFREPGYLWQLDLPFVWGPIGGLVQMPAKFLPSLGYYGFFYYLGRNILNWLQSRFLVRPRMAARRAGTGLISATSDTAFMVKKIWGCHSHVLSEIGLPDNVSESFTLRDVGHEPLRLVWNAGHFPRKALPILLHAAALLPAETKWTLDILGEGRETVKWQRMARDLGIENKCQWHGWVIRDSALRVMSNSHLMIISSLQDLTSTVTVEALSQGLPIVCLDHCGFSDVITDECGIKIPVTNPQKVVSDMVDAIVMLAADEKKRRKMAAAALRRAADYEWVSKAQQLTKIYANVIREWRVK